MKVSFSENDLLCVECDDDTPAQCSLFLVLCSRNSKCKLVVVVIRTFGKLSNAADLYDKCHCLSESLAKDLRDERLVVSKHCSFCIYGVIWHV